MRSAARYGVRAYAVEYTRRRADAFRHEEWSRHIRLLPGEAGRRRDQRRRFQESRAAILP